ncbi:MAG: hypothetical protein ABIP78_11505 [Pyrinomonadaceae bacterium]
MTNQSIKICPRCGSQKIKSWTEMTADEKFVVERLPMSAEYAREERKKHRFCTRCWFEDAVSDKSNIA